MIGQKFKYFVAVLKRENRRLIKDPIYWFTALVLPMVSLLFFVACFWNGVARELPVAVVDEDKTPLSRKLVSMIDATPCVHVAYEPSDMLEARDMIYEGKVYAVVQIVNNFEKNVMGGGQARVVLHNSGANISTNGLISKDVQTATLTMSTGIQLNVLQAKGLTARQAFAQAMPVRFDKHILTNPYLSYAYFIAPAFMSMMIFLFTILLSIYTIGSEIKNATCEDWLESAGGSILTAVFGKYTMVILIMTIYNIINFFLMFIFMGVPANGNFWYFLLCTIVYLSAYQCIGMFVVTATCNLRLSLSLCGGYSVMAFTFSGLAFPSLAFPDIINVAKYLFPFTYYVQIAIDQTMRGAPIAYSFNMLAGLVVFQLLAVFSFKKLDRVCRNKKYWGRI